MVTPAHAQGACSLQYAVKEALERMGLRRVFLDYTAVPHEHPQGTKQPDAAWVPKKLPRNRTMVLEVAVSGSLARLRRDIDMWVDPARGNVSIALAMKINRRRPEIQLEKYERDSQGSTQTVLIRKSEGQVAVSGSLIIPFESFVGRAPSKERDIQIVEAALREIAEDIWCAQQFE
ncbi:uncharacterized protein N7500_005484 [Penicillium coprophilum]|uniref:uncharacterized protein n=1 Tax=Penicillium coprophilum TaxID=36646 RepID=UPI0023893498|nr:uncharacterized protein N7500_005484 [Penicillium coprophilum]KAJ5163654.1 hypothetical protein N7500_005484 [Penicillium coprophilum]